MRCLAERLWQSGLRGLWRGPRASGRRVQARSAHPSARPGPRGVRAGTDAGGHPARTNACFHGQWEGDLVGQKDIPRAGDRATAKLPPRLDLCAQRGPCCPHVEPDAWVAVVLFRNFVSPGEL